ncbi:SAM-dependent chlorinase/fluorinase, partial [Candidatus Bathyarchaeota archaeon]|nr:SAM-dependent chlorinase/fluorinase [Candidatus Bathyarchaeota archaeon]
MVALLSDFGTRDAYVAQMKAVILSLSPKSIIVDVSHEIARHNVFQGMFVLATAAPYFPPGTIFLAVVDPEVGGLRRPLLLETGKSKFVGPDNGILTLAAEKEGVVNAYHLTESKYFAGEISPTFHGRDIFAHVAGHLAEGVSPSLMGQSTSEYVRLKIPEARLEDGKIHSTVIYVDGFGNVVTNIESEILSRGRF